MGQSEFSEKGMSLSDDNDKKMKKSMKAYKAFEFNVSEVKKLIRKNTDPSKPVEFTLNLDNQKFKFTLFENDVLSEDCQFYLDGKPYKQKREVDTFSGYVNDHPKNALRLYITDNRISGIFKTNDADYVIGHLADQGVSEKTNNGSKKQLYIVKSEDEFSSLGTNFCANAKLTKPSGGRVSAPANCANSPRCRYVRVAIETDNEFANNISSTNGFPTGLNIYGVIQDMVNRADYAYSTSLNIRLKCVYMGAYVGVTDPYTASLANIWTEFGNLIFLNNVQKDVLHLLSGRPFGGTSQTGFNFGQAFTSSICSPFPSQSPAGFRPGSMSTIACDSNYGNCATGTGVISFSDASLVMAHEIGHILGASDDVNTLPKSVMYTGEGKNNYFSSTSSGEIYNFHCNKTCLENNIVNSSFTNRLQLTMNGNIINTTPVFINKNTKVINIPPDNNPYIELLPNTTVFNYSNPSVYVFYNTNTSTSFALGSANGFTLNVSAKDKCNNYYWNVPFTYSPAGARLSDNLYPVPTNETLNIDVENPESIEIERIQVFDEKTNLKLEIEPNQTDNKYQLNTSTLKSGVHYVHIIYKNGEISKKRILISHE